MARADAIDVAGLLLERPTHDTPMTVLGWPPLEPDRPVEIELASGQRIAGQAREQLGAWLGVDQGGALIWVNVSQVAMVVQGGHLPAVKSRGGRRRAAASTDGNEAGDTPTPGAGEWQDQELKLLVDAMLDGADDGRLAREFDRSRSAIRQIRAAFECARGNLVEDDIGPAMAWVPRLRRVLSP